MSWGRSKRIELLTMVLQWAGNDEHLDEDEYHRMATKLAGAYPKDEWIEMVALDAVIKHILAVKGAESG